MVVILDKELQDELKRIVDDNYEWFDERMREEFERVMRN